MTHKQQLSLSQQSFRKQQPIISQQYNGDGTKAAIRQSGGQKRNGNF